jgi:hypothetical protein
MVDPIRGFSSAAKAEVASAADKITLNAGTKCRLLMFLV